MKRELKRIPLSIRNYLQHVIAPWRRRYHDLRRAENVHVFPGDVPATRECAVVLIYQPEALLGSLFLTLEHLKSRGISTVLVANHSFDPADIDRLEPLCMTMIERPNLGYDFGGYREGILWILNNVPSVNNLFVMNDSIWFPTLPDCTLIEEARAAPEEIFGLFMYQNPLKKHRTHIQSYFYRFSGDLINSADFRGFWEKLPLYQNKRLVVRRFEIGLSEYFVARGASINAAYRPDSVIDALLTLPTADFRTVLRLHLEKPGRDHHRLTSLLEGDLDDPAFRDRARRVLRSQSFITRLVDDHPVLCIQTMRMPILKKIREKEFIRQRAILRESPEILSELDPVIQRELISWDKG
ncbi:rhamnan synthesis F family protein [Pseudooceanicola sediminis]|uniref:rhamnan synthesis F family protein n=1 Tax=Pseudooceanicola sediminis TaxID=2211117 RepID=UPI001313FDC5|nr:rhamnan synthesis F family protein [Pseudooceanicola sediminis]